MSSANVDLGYLSIPENLEFPTEKGATAHAFYYAPQNTDYDPPPGEKPPLLVTCHGGPHSATSLDVPGDPPSGGADRLHRLCRRVHGFQQSETIKRALEAELYFYARVFGFELADAVEPVQIDNM